MKESDYIKVSNKQSLRILQIIMNDMTTGKEYGVDKRLFTAAYRAVCRMQEKAYRGVEVNNE